MPTEIDNAIAVHVNELRKRIDELEARSPDDFMGVKFNLLMTGITVEYEGRMRWAVKRSEGLGLEQQFVPDGKWVNAENATEDDCFDTLADAFAAARKARDHG